ncbi:cytochrome C oxidase subunit II [Halopenitus sp. H-Gu1]|uniref:cytochrome C oxidase subunit II n=1 Tax=Halopenitus sp. H-Gu1 TaxID=3242697 RepID=UPI00359EB04B
MTAPMDPPDGNWWDEPVNRRETIWLGIAGAWSLVIFGWMSGFTRFGDQNPVGKTYDVDPGAYRDRVQEYKEAAAETDEGIVPPNDSVYIGAMRFNWDGLPVVLEAGTEYDIHLGAYDVQHGFSIRPEETLSKQINLQVFPGNEWIVPMTFDEPGTYHVICNEFCGEGHRTMHGTLIVEEP